MTLNPTSTLPIWTRNYINSGVFEHVGSARSLGWKGSAAGMSEPQVYRHPKTNIFYAAACSHDSQFINRYFHVHA